MTIKMGVDHWKEQYFYGLKQARGYLNEALALASEKKNQPFLLIMLVLLMLSLIAPKFLSSKQKTQKKKSEVDRLKAESESFRRRQAQESKEMATHGLISTPLGRRSTRQRKARAPYAA